MYPKLLQFQIPLFNQQITLYSYGIFLLLAIILGIIILYWQLKKYNLKTKNIFDNILWTILGGLIGARLFFVLFHIRFYISHKSEIFKAWEGGLNFYGGLVGGFVVLFLWLYLKNRKELFRWLDCAMISLVFGHSLGMIGSFLLGSDYGRPTNLPWAVKIPLLQDNVSRHPSQIYEFLAYLLIFIFLVVFSHKIGKISGRIFFLGLLLHSISRFFIEFFRAPDIVLYHQWLNFTLAHLLSLLALCVGIAGLIWLPKKQNLS